MKKSPLLERIRAGISKDVKREINFSFEIADRISDILLKKNISQRELATKLNKSEAEISKWMRGTHNFTISTIAKIENVLGEPIIEVTGKPLKKEYVCITIPANDGIKLNAHSSQKANKIPLIASFESSYDMFMNLNLLETISN